MSMSDHIKVYERMGSILVRLPFSSSLKNIYGGPITEEEQEALNHALQTAVSMLIRARQYYELDDEAVEACARGFATQLSSTFIGPRIRHKPPAQTMEVDGNWWELVFDPGPEVDQQLMDKQGRVWRKFDFRS